MRIKIFLSILIDQFLHWKTIYIGKEFILSKIQIENRMKMSVSTDHRRLSSEIEIDFPRRLRILSRDLTLDFTGKHNEQQLREHHH